jgi:hypothetical protein
MSRHLGAAKLSRWIRGLVHVSWGPTKHGSSTPHIGTGGATSNAIYHFQTASRASKKLIPWGGWSGMRARGVVRFLVAVLAVGVLAGPANAKGMLKRCAQVDGQSISVSTELDRGDSFLPDPSPKIIQAPGKAGTLLALGPPLGPMDSPKLETALSCTAKGIVLNFTVTRSANFRGATLQNVVWRPVIRIQVVVRRAEAVVRAVWRMRLTTGAEVDHAQSPAAPYPDEKYPIAVSKVVRSASTGKQ